MVERVAFDAPVVSPDGSGGQVTDWGAELDAYVCRANFKYLRGSESVQAARLAGRQPVVVTIHANPESAAIGTDWRMRDLERGTVYAIHTKVPTDDRGWFELTCESGVAV